MPRQTNQIRNIMKRLFILIAITFAMVACGNNSTQNTDNETDSKTDTTNIVSATEASEDLGKPFLENFYQGLEEVFGEEEADLYVNEYLTPEAKQYLIDQYDYDCDGVCMALWVFFYEGGGDVCCSSERTIELIDGLSYRVTNTYYNEGEKTYQYRVKLGLVKDGDSFKIDSIIKEGEEYYD